MTSEKAERDCWPMKSQSFGNLWDRALLPHSRASPPLLPMAASLLWTHTGVGGSDYRPETQRSCAFLSCASWLVVAEGQCPLPPRSCHSTRLSEAGRAAPFWVTQEGVCSMGPPPRLWSGSASRTWPRSLAGRHGERGVQREVLGAQAVSPRASPRRA